MGMRLAILAIVFFSLIGCKTTKEVTTIDEVARNVVDSTSTDSTYTDAHAITNVVDSITTSYDIVRIVFDTSVTDSATGTHPIKEVVSIAARQGKVESTNKVEDIATTNVVNVAKVDSASSTTRIKAKTEKQGAHTKLGFFLFILIFGLVCFLFARDGRLS